jgi:hypothetical protein
MSKIPALTTPFDSTSLEERKPNAPSCDVLATYAIPRHQYTAYSVLDRHSYESILVRRNDLAHVLRAIPKPITAAVYPHKDGKVLRI